MKKLLLLGGNELHKGFSEWKCRSQVDSIIVVDWNERPSFIGDYHIKEDIKDVDKVLDVVKQKNKESWLICYTSADIAVPTQIAVHKYMGLLFPSEEAVWNCIIKSRSTMKWSEGEVLNRFSLKCEDIADMKIPSYVRDIIVKPNMSSGSRGITIIKEENIKDNLENAFEKAVKYSADHAVIVEEFLHGIEYTVEMLGDDYGNVAVYGISKKYHTKYTTDNKIATKLHYNPQDVSDELIEKIARAAQKCYKMLGLKNSLGHLELIISDDGRISPIEIGARSSGYAATHCVDAINDDNFLLKYSQVIRGEKVEDKIIFDRKKSSMYFFYDLPPGKSCQETNIMEYAFDGIESVQWNRDNLKANNVFHPVMQDAERYGYEILVGDREVLTIDNIESMEKKFKENFMD